MKDPNSNPRLGCELGKPLPLLQLPLHFPARNMGMTGQYYLQGYCEDYGDNNICKVL